MKAIAAYVIHLFWLCSFVLTIFITPSCSNPGDEYESYRLREGAPPGHPMICWEGKSVETATYYIMGVGVYHGVEGFEQALRFVRELPKSNRGTYVEFRGCREDIVELYKDGIHIIYLPFVRDSTITEFSEFSSALVGTFISEIPIPRSDMPTEEEVLRYPLKEEFRIQPTLGTDDYRPSEVPRPE